jgi:hypothetical protein
VQRVVGHRGHGVGDAAEVRRQAVDEAVRLRPGGRGLPVLHRLVAVGERVARAARQRDVGLEVDEVGDRDVGRELRRAAQVRVDLGRGLEDDVPLRVGGDPVSAELLRRRAEEPGRGQQLVRLRGGRQQQPHVLGQGPLQLGPTRAGKPHRSALRFPTRFTAMPGVSLMARARATPEPGLIVIGEVMRWPSAGTKLW